MSMVHLVYSVFRANVGYKGKKKKTVTESSNERTKLLGMYAFSSLFLSASPTNCLLSNFPPPPIPQCGTMDATIIALSSEIPALPKVFYLKPPGVGQNEALHVFLATKNFRFF